MNNIHLPADYVTDDKVGNVQEILSDLENGDKFKFITPKKCLNHGCNSLLFTKTNYTIKSSILVVELEPDLEGQNKNSLDFYFPRTLTCGSTDYELVARIFSTEADGGHFGTRVLRHNGIYIYDDLTNKNYAQMQESAVGFE